MNEVETKHVTVRLPLPVYKKLIKEGKRDDRTRSNIICRALIQYLGGVK